MVPVLSNPHFLHLSGDSSQQSSHPFCSADAPKLCIPHLTQLLCTSISSHCSGAEGMFACCKLQPPSNLKITAAPGWGFKFNSSFWQVFWWKIHISNFRVVSSLECGTENPRLQKFLCLSLCVCVRGTNLSSLQVFSEGLPVWNIPNDMCASTALIKLN